MCSCRLKFYWFYTYSLKRPKHIPNNNNKMREREKKILKNRLWCSIDSTPYSPSLSLTLYPLASLSSAQFCKCFLQHVKICKVWARKVEIRTRNRAFLYPDEEERKREREKEKNELFFSVVICFALWCFFYRFYFFSSRHETQKKKEETIMPNGEVLFFFLLCTKRKYTRI